jgi:hypothetical protein
LWDISQAWLVWQDVQSMESALNQVQDRDRELLREAQQEGLDLSEAALQVLPKEIEFANQLIEKRSFSWTRFLTELERAIPQRIAVNSIRLDPDECHDYADWLREGAGRRDHPHRDLSRPSPIQGTGVWGSIG